MVDLSAFPPFKRNRARNVEYPATFDSLLLFYLQITELSNEVLGNEVDQHEKYKNQTLVFKRAEKFF